MKKNICLIPEVTSLGGPRTFQRNLIEWSKSSDTIEFHFDKSRKDIDGFLVIGGPMRCLPVLLRARLKGIPVVQRLNGMNWIHRVKPCTLRYKIHSELANIAIAFFRRFICTGIVYQSPFCQKRWDAAFGKIKKPQTIIYNGVDTKGFTPGNTNKNETIRILLAEGSFRHGMDFGLDVAVDLVTGLQKRLNRPIRLTIAGKAEEDTVHRIQAAIPGMVDFVGVIDKTQLAKLEQNADLFFSSEIHPACPNAVLEALASGLPVIGFDTGALKDIVGDGGIIIPYGTNPWRLEKPETLPLITAAEKMIRNQQTFRDAARKRAEELFRLDYMVEAYIQFILNKE